MVQAKDSRKPDADDPKKVPLGNVRKWARFKKIPSHLWMIHGEFYNLAPFYETHPGGKENLMFTQGRDVTELFESVHSLSKRDVHALLKKYKISEEERTELEETLPEKSITEDAFSWNDGDFYSVLSAKVNNYFDSIGGNHKATWTYWFKITLMFSLWLFFGYQALTTTGFYMGCFAAFISGVIMNMLGFCVMHDGSHYGISKRPWVNRVLHTLWSDWNAWNHLIWLTHHVYGHHSYTGLFGKDPDLVHGYLLWRKSAENKFKNAYKTQHVHAFFLLLGLPNQHLGQAVLYGLAASVKHVFGVPLGRMSRTDLIASSVIYSFSFFTHLVLPFLLAPQGVVLTYILARMACYWGGQGLGYFVNICPNHDTLETHNLVMLENQAKNADTKRDWGVQQVIASADHSVGTGLW
eukprot:CAMPEP_0174250388 /NCGR_PEP_ID=MMETSP0439-20130205/540_1 /TAXON_ID=0 /ORGANISM="Stereomyxa ramosa, Strain Chinc5" /LENGTH=408 /DNA_ID=CAMNT_0015330439 /DNA_START=66 /DNA_END=1289 /DNA_ORIENTATION=+